ncbi:MAG: LacI family DNA-binding transcriptional regulator [Alphaproteobacteria bacterium]|nr:LacI family DNA-binding transcriptional regulator [Alphaproteobacteria bacterium]
MAAKNKSTRRIKTAKIADVARIAGVSVATVSRALAKPGMVEAVTRARVVAAAKRLGYTPNVAARNLRARRSNMALVVVPNIGNAYFGELLRGIDAALTRRGYGLIIANLDLTSTRDNSPDHEERYVDLAAAGQVDGVLLLNGYVPKGPVRTMLDARLPIVAVGERIRGAKFPQVEVDNRAAARGAVEHLVGLGHKRIAYLSGRPRSHLDSARRLGFRDALTGAQGLEWTGDYYFASGVAAAEAMLRGKPQDRPTALFAASDEMAIGFLKTVLAAGVSVPRDMSIVGFDGIDYARFSEPALTTVVVPRRQIGETAGEMLADLMAGSGDVPAHVRLATELRVRGSTGPAPGPR